MSDGDFSVADVLDRGLAAVPDALIRLDAPDGGSRQGVAALVRESFGAAIEVDGFHDLIANVIASADPLTTATALIAGKYAALGGASGVLGPTTGVVSGCPDGFGFYRHFRNGSIYWHPATGVHEVHGPIRAKWAGLGWERGFLGYPTSDELKGADPDQRGRFNRFQGGAIHWHPEIDLAAGTLAAPLGNAVFVMARTPMTTVNAKDLAADQLMTKVAAVGDLAAVTVLGVPETVLGSARGAHEVHGEIAAHYRSLGGSGSFLGYPTTDETATPDRVGRYNHFQAGSIYWTPSTGAHEVHGLIRQLWAQRGWERNAALGYPVTDELIPDRRVGHRRPETRRKPIALPVDVIKLPAEATLSGFSPLISNVPAVALRRDVRVFEAERTPGNGNGNGSRIAIDAAEVVRPRHDIEPVSTPAAEASLNRYGDFEGGVLFWRRGESAAYQLQPWTQTHGGTAMQRTPAEVIAAMQPSLQQALGRLSGASPQGFSFSGTTGYSYDGANVHNRRHRVFAQLLTSHRLDVPLGGSVAVPTIVSVELQLEVAFEPVDRRVIVCLADWSFAPATAIDASPPLDRQLHTQLDALLFAPVELIGLPDSDDGRPIAVLSAKTMPDGTVCLFVEPAPESRLVAGPRESVLEVVTRPTRTGRFADGLTTAVELPN